MVGRCSIFGSFFEILRIRFSCVWSWRFGNGVGSWIFVVWVSIGLFGRFTRRFCFWCLVVLRNGICFLMRLRFVSVRMIRSCMSICLVSGENGGFRWLRVRVSGLLRILRFVVVGRYCMLILRTWVGMIGLSYFLSMRFFIVRGYVSFFCVFIWSLRIM